MKDIEILNKYQFHIQDLDYEHKEYSKCLCEMLYQQDPNTERKNLLVPCRLSNLKSIQEGVVTRFEKVTQGQIVIEFITAVRWDVYRKEFIYDEGTVPNLYRLDECEELKFGFDLAVFSMGFCLELLDNGSIRNAKGIDCQKVIFPELNNEVEELRKWSENITCHSSK